MDGAGVGWTGQERDGLRVLQIAHVEDGDAVRIAVTDIGIAAMHHDLDAVAASALVGVANELDVAGCYRIHGLPLSCRAAPRRPLKRGDSKSETSNNAVAPQALDFTGGDAEPVVQN